MAAVVVIPARMASTRLPGKPLLAETGKPLVQHVWEQARRARRVDHVIIATDDQRVHCAAVAFGATVMMTAATHRSGTERVAEAARRLDPSLEPIVNVQGDEPEIDPAAIDHAIALLDEDPAAHVATLATAILDENLCADPACVKVVCDHSGRALYFSRCPVPYVRNTAAPANDANGGARHYQHLGLYAYRREALCELERLPESPLEQLEGLEQLRWLQAGWCVKVGIVDHTAQGIDTPEDYRRFVQRHRKRYTDTRALPT